MLVLIHNLITLKNLKKMKTKISTKIDLRKHFVPNLPNVEKFKKSFHYTFTSVDMEEVNVEEARNLLKTIQATKKTISDDFINLIYPANEKQYQIIGTLENGKTVTLAVARLLQINPACFDGIIKKVKKDNKTSFIYDIGQIVFDGNTLEIFTTNEAANNSNEDEDDNEDE